MRISLIDGGTYTFWDLLLACGNNLCSDPRGRIFALAAFAEEIDTAQIREEMTAQELFFQVLLQVGPGNLQIIELANLLLDVPGLDVGTMISEIPDYTVRAWDVVFAEIATPCSVGGWPLVNLGGLHELLQLRGWNTYTNGKMLGPYSNRPCGNTWRPK